MYRSVQINADDFKRSSSGPQRGVHTREVVLQLLYGTVEKIVNMEVLMPPGRLRYPAKTVVSRRRPTQKYFLLDKNCGRILRQALPGSSHRQQTSYSPSMCEAERPVDVASSTLSGVVMTVILYRVAIQRIPPETVPQPTSDPIATLPFAAF
jgi:hypothetical protein